MKTFSLFLALSLYLLAGLGLAQKGATPVFVAPVQKVDFVDEVEALGTLQANENVNLNSTVTERVTRINFTDNQRVKRGHVLVEMDSAEERAELIEERSLLNEAQRQITRLKPLVQRGAASQTTMDEWQRQWQGARARIKAIQSRIDERRVVAPFDGIVGIRNISVGALARPETLITTIDDDSVMKLDFSVPEVFLATLDLGIEVKARARAYPDRIFTGTITSVDSRIDPVTRAVAARALLDNSEGLLKAGMLMRLVLHKNPRQALVIPEEALIKNGTQNFVLVIVEQDGTTKANRQLVKIGERRKGEVEIVEGVQEGWQIVTHGTLRVRDGAEVTVRAIERQDESLTELLKQNADGGS